VTDSGILDFSSKDFGEPDARSPQQRRRSRLTTLVLVLVLTAVAVFGVWLHLRRTHETDLAAFEDLRQRFTLVDRNARPLLHGESPPCGESDEAGVVTRTYSAESGPTPAEVEEALRLVGFWPAQEQPGALFSLELVVDDHRLAVDVMGTSPDAPGGTVRATSSATALACRLP
jgi:hypothetical protein